VTVSATAAALRNAALLTRGNENPFTSPHQ